jgi:hypothetical protein
VTEFSAADWPEAFVSDTATSRVVSRATKAGKLRKLSSRLYTRNFTDTPEAIVRRNLWQVVGGFFPDGLIADRTALENAPAEDGSICLVADRGSDVSLPGLMLRPRRGVPPLASDRPFIGGLYLSSLARAYLENMRPSRARGGFCARTLSRREIEERLDALLRRSGEETLSRLRDEVRAIALALGLEDEARELDVLIGALLGTRDAKVSSPLAKARRAGRPYDPERMERFQVLHRALRDHAPVIRLAKARLPVAEATLTFFEAYFSNFIEGTEFEVAEAADIVFRGVIPSERPQDAHDVLGTWRIVGDSSDMRLVPGSYADLVRLLQARHASIMELRPEKGPGRFKKTSNRAGATTFVAPELVEGTLEQGFDLCRSLEMAFQRAVFMMFLISEVHPFADGNGRTARIMMNAELVASGEERIIIPTVYRSNYLSALKALSQSGVSEPVIRMLDFAQKWTAAIAWGELETTRRELEVCNAFLDPLEAEEQGLRLKLPPSEGL